MERAGGIKGFVATWPGKAALTALATVVLVLSFLFIGVLIAIAAFLLFMLAVPIYLGWKRPRELAVLGLVALLIAGPFGALLYAQQIRTPSPSVGSDPQTGPGGTGSVITDASVAPFTGAAGATFTFSATIHPGYLPAGAKGPEYALLYLSTCAGATTSNTSFCGGGGYPFWYQKVAFPSALVNDTTVHFSQRLNMSNLWFWLIAFAFTNTTNVTRYIFVDPQSIYGAVQGPVSGDFMSTTWLVLPALYSELFLYVALIFYAGLLLYVYLKARAARRAGGGPVGSSLPPEEPGPAGAPAGPGSTPAPPGRPGERSCPNCGAVIYPSETSCWKCGQAIGPATPAAGAPLK